MQPPIAAKRGAKSPFEGALGLFYLGCIDGRAMGMKRELISSSGIVYRVTGLPPSFRISAKIEKVLNYIDFFYNQPLNVSHAADFLDVHPDYLSRLFKSEVGVRFHDYVLWKRIERATILLKSRHMSIKAISYEVGFGSPGVFCKVFRKLTGSSPGGFTRSQFLALSKRKQIFVIFPRGSNPVAQPSPPSDRQS